MRHHSLSNHLRRLNSAVLRLTTSLLLLIIAVPAAAASRAEVYNHAKAGTVLIVAIDDKTNSVSLGSGFLINTNGLVVTNAHVLEDSSRVLVYVRNQQVYTSASIVTVDPDRDLAALRIPPSSARAMVLMDHPVADGSDVMAVGYPRLTDILNMGFALHPTIVPANVNGTIQGRSRTQYRYAPFIQITGLINQGSSGGPLVDLDSGEVAGMVVLQVPYLERARDRSGAGIGSVMIRSGIGYAIPSSVIRQWLAEKGLESRGELASSVPLASGADLQPSADRSFATGHLIFTIAQVLPKDPDLYLLAIYHYQAALALHPQDANLMRHLGISYSALGRFDEAVEVMLNAFANEPTSAMVAYELGLAQEANGRGTDALATWRKFLEQASAVSDPEGWRVKMRDAVDRLNLSSAAAFPSLAVIPVKARDR